MPEHFKLELAWSGERVLVGYHTPYADIKISGSLTPEAAIAFADAPPADEDKPLTVSELAEMIAPSATLDERARVIRRLRHLTLVGALDPRGATHTGAGRHRLYDPSAAVDAAVLVALGDMGLTVGVLRQIGNFMQRATRTAAAE